MQEDFKVHIVPDQVLLTQRTSEVHKKRCMFWTLREPTKPLYARLLKHVNGNAIYFLNHPWLHFLADQLEEVALADIEPSLNEFKLFELQEDLATENSSILKQTVGKDFLETRVLVGKCKLVPLQPAAGPVL